MFSLPNDIEHVYSPLGRCLYCDATAVLGKEHVLAKSFGGRKILPRASCAKCGTMTSEFERTVARTMLGPMRMYFNIDSRRRDERPEKLPLKVKLRPNDDWSYIDVDRKLYPFLILFPLLNMPGELAGRSADEDQTAKCASFWIRAASFESGVHEHTEVLAQSLKVAAIMPEGRAEVDAFARMLAKVGHSFATAELVGKNFRPTTIDVIRSANARNALQFIGGSPHSEPAGSTLHDIDFVYVRHDPTLVLVHIRLFAVLGTPTYLVVAGRCDDPEFVGRSSPPTEASITGLQRLS